MARAGQDQIGFTVDAETKARFYALVKKLGLSNADTLRYLMTLGENGNITPKIARIRKLEAELEKAKSELFRGEK